MAIGDRIRAIRTKKGMTQKQLGEKCGMADSAIRKYESGRITPKIETVNKIAKALEVSTVEILDAFIPNKAREAMDAVVNLSAVCSAICEHSDIPEDLKEWIQKEIPDVSKTIDSFVDLYIYSLKRKPKSDEEMTLIENFYKLNQKGQKIAVQRIEELTKIPDYMKNAMD